MKKPFSLQSSNSQRTAKHHGRVSRARPRRRPLRFEALEGRAMLSLTAQMVLDINTNTPSSDPSALVAIGSTTFFIADDDVHGVELWKSDGTAAGTTLVREIYPGNFNGDYGGYYAGNYIPSDLTSVNGTLFFTANDGTHGRELWKSDGTAAGTTLVKDIYPGAVGSGPSNLTNVNGMLFFTAENGTNGRELWKSDGTAAGTVLVKEVIPGWEGFQAREMTNVNGTLFFSIHGSGLWKSDGTSAGTVLVKDFVPYIDGDNYARNLASVNGTLFFTVKDATHGWELWKSNGTAAGTVLVKDINPGIQSSLPSHLTNVNGTLFFVASDSTSGSDLWKSDGTAAGTVLVKYINPPPPGGYTGGSNPSNLTIVNGTLFFTASSGLWKTDGTAAGTVQVKLLGAGNLTNVNGTLFFAVSYPAGAGDGSEIWKSDGTEAGTVLVKDIYPGSAWYGPTSLVNANGTLMFAADDGRYGVELWSSDGTAAGTALVKDINTNGIGSNHRNQTNVNGTLFFSADDGVHGTELWKSDGTAAGTTLVKDVYPGGFTGYFGDYQAYSSEPSGLTNVNGTLFFTANNGQLWKSDGTGAGTVLVSSSAWNPRNLTNVNDTLFFTASYDGVELWKSDGTVAGTTLVKDIYPGGQWVESCGDYGCWRQYVPNSSSPGQLTSLNGTLFFTAEDGTNGRELWKSDGTAAGTVLVKDIRPGLGSGNADAITDVNGTLFLSASDGTTGRELWKSDGTGAGTVLVKDIRPGSGGSYPGPLTDVNGTLFFSAGDAATGRELWTSDGTAAGTILVKDIVAGSGGASPSNLTNVNATLFFTASDGTNAALWKSDGTVAGTVLVKAINPGSGWSLPSQLTNVNGTLFFLADDGAGAPKIWQSDGTAAGTVLVTDLLTDTLTNVNGTLFFSADDGVHGRELWTLVVDSVPALTIGDVTVTEGHAGTQIATFTVTLSAASTLPVTVDYATLDGTAAALSDYGALSGTISFAPAETSQSITVLVHGDLLAEPDETFFVNLSGATNASITGAQGLGTISNDDFAAPAFSINDVQATEGHAGTTTAAFTLTLSQNPTQPVTVTINTADNTATTADPDYDGLSNVVRTFNPGDPLTQTVNVTLRGDTKFETDQTFFVNLSNATGGAIIGDNQGLGIILNDDSRPTISMSDRSVLETNSSFFESFFAITLSNPSDETLTVRVDTANGTATTADNDYVAVVNRTVTFNPGVTLQQTPVRINGDTKFETDQTFFVNLSNPTNASSIADNQGQGTIQNDDTRPTITIAPATAAEGDALTFNLSLSNLSDEQVTVQASTADGTATTADNHYTAIVNQLVTFAPGENSATVTVQSLEDADFEADQTFTVILSNPVNASAISGSPATGTITNDDTPPAIYIDDASIVEGNSGTRTMSFTVSLSHPSGQGVSVNFATANGTAKTSDNDYVAASGRLDFAPGETTKTITVTIRGDTRKEANERFLVKLSGAVGATIADGQGEGTIANDDGGGKLNGKNNRTTSYALFVDAAFNDWMATLWRRRGR